METKLQILSAFKEQATQYYRNENARYVSRFITNNSLHIFRWFLVFVFFNSKSPALGFSLIRTPFL